MNKHMISNNPERFEDFLTTDTKAQELWDLAGKIPHEQVLSDVEFDQDVEKLFNRLHIESQSNTPIHHIIKNRRSSLTAWLVAAALLLIAGSAYFITPVTLNVPYGETFTHTFPDGSTVELNSGSTIHYSRLFGKTHRTLSMNGEGYFEITKQDLPFRIQTGEVTTEVLGTVFNLRSWQSEPTSDHESHESENTENLEITVISGTVLLKNGDRSMKLQGGEAGQWSPEENTFTGPIDGNFNHALAWREAGISFFEQSLPSVLQTLERRFDVPISWSRQAAGRFGGEITAYYSAPLNLERILMDITTIKSLHYVSHSGGYQIIDRTETQPKNP